MANVGGAAVAVIVACVAALIAVGCGAERTPSPGVADPPVVVAAAGEIARCGDEGAEATARVLSDIVEGNLGVTVLALGNNAYPRGSAEDYADCYGPTWGRFKGRTRPVPGNHEYYTEGAEGYFGYFGEAAGEPGEGYYSYDLGEWHIVALNSNCREVNCGPASPQTRWLEEDLAANDEGRCTLAYMHHPRFSSGEKHGSTAGGVEQLWEVLYEAGAEAVLSAHQDNYERFAPQDPGGAADPEGGIRQFVVGTGGAGQYPIVDPIANSEAHTDADGVLRLTLRPEGYEWRFVPVEGESFTDSGSARCH